MATRNIYPLLAALGVSTASIGAYYAIAASSTTTISTSGATTTSVTAPRNTETRVLLKPLEEVRESTEQAHAPRHSDNDVALLRGELARASGRIDALGGELARLTGAQVNLEQSLLDRMHTEADGVDLPAKEVHDLELARQERIEAFKDNLRTEDVDLAWSARVSEDIERALTPDGDVALDIYDIDCRATRCLVALHHDSNASFEAFQDAAAGNLGAILPDMEFHYEEVGDGTMETTIFMRRRTTATP